MLEREQPDIVHPVTILTVLCYIWVESAAQVGVGALVIEKLIALKPKEAERLDATQEKTDL